MTAIRPDLSPGVDALAELTKAIAVSVADPRHPAVEIPGGPEEAWEISNPLVVNPLVPLVGNGAWIKRAANWAFAPNTGQNRQMVVWSQSPATAVVRGVCFDGNAAAQSAAFVGDTVSIWDVEGVDFADCYTRNMRGLTTSSTDKLRETFSLQVRRVTKARLTRCHSWNDDGSPTATGIVFHWVTDWQISDTIVSDFHGQGIGCYGGSGKGVVDHCVTQRTHHGLNFERGSEGSVGQSITVLGGDRRSIAVNCPIAVCINGNDPAGTPLGAIDIADYEADSCGVVLYPVNTPSPVAVTGLRAKAPTTALIQTPWNGKAFAWASKLTLDAAVSGLTVPTAIGLGGHEHATPSTWKVASV